VPTLKEANGHPIIRPGAWRGIAGPKGLARGCREQNDGRAEEGFRLQGSSKEFMSNRGFGNGVGRRRPNSRPSWTRATAQMGVAMKAAGLSKA